MKRFLLALALLFASPALAAYNTPSPGNAAAKNVYVSTTGNDANNGLSWDAPFLTLQAAENAANPGGVVYVGAGTYTLSATLLGQPGVSLVCSRGVTITQANAANLTLLVDLTTNSANGASIHGCTFDSNYSNNPVNASAYQVFIATANDVTLEGNTFNNATGSAVGITSGLRPIIRGNTFTNAVTGGVYVITGVASTATRGHFDDNIFQGTIGQHAITLNQSDFNSIDGNTLTALAQVGMTVNTSGTAMTWVSGPTFSTLTPGQFITINGGTELLISSVNSATSITTSTTGGSLSGVPAAAGPGDLISLGNSSYNTVANNRIVGGGAGGIVVSNFFGGETSVYNIVSNNTVLNTVSECIGVEGTPNGGSLQYNLKVTNNYAFDCALGGSAVFPATRAAIAAIDFGTNLVQALEIQGNHIAQDNGGSGMTSSIILSGVGAGLVEAGNNYVQGPINAGGISGAISSVVLSAGWGSTATVTNIVSWGNAFQFQINSSGTGQSATPTITVNTVATSLENIPIFTCVQGAGSQPASHIFGQNNSSSTTQTLVYEGTPIAGDFTLVVCRA